MNKIALVTGGARGLGEQIVRSFLDRGFMVVINFYKSEKKAKKLSDEFGKNVLIVQADISKNKDIKNMMIKINDYFNDYPSILINNALAEYVFNGDLRTHAEDISWKEISNQLDVTLKGSIEVLQALIPSMKKRKFGRVINVGTNLTLNPVVPYHDYIIAKSALLGMTRSFAKDLGPSNITVNMVSGGLLKVTDASAGTPEEVFDSIATMTPLQKVTTVKDFADAVTFFALDDARAITGQNLVVDGGLTFN